MDTQRYGFSLPVGRIFGIQIRLHLLFIILIAVRLLQAANLGWDVVKQECVLLGLLWGSVLLHELGHCYFGYRMGGHAEQIILWPLGGLAYVDHPRTWRADFWTTFGGPFVNAVLLVLSGVGLIFQRAFWHFDPYSWLGGSWVQVLFSLNFVMVLLNILPLFPLDGGQMARAFLWRKWGFGAATIMTIKVAKVFSVLLGIFGMVTLGSGGFMLCFLALFCYFSAEQERVALEMGAGEEGFMGYDFSNGYTSLEASSPRPARRGSFFKRISRKLSSWRAERKARREKDEEIEVKTRVDTLLEKIAREGMGSLSDQERDFLKDASKYYHF